MSKLKAVDFDQFTLKKAKIGETSVQCEFEENRVIDGKAHLIAHTISCSYIPHPDLIRLRDTLREYLVKAYHLGSGYEVAIKYLKGEQKKIAEDGMIDLYDKVEITGISIGGDEQLRGVVISGKILSFNKSKCAMNTPRIVFSSEKLGYELDVEGQIELIEREVYKYLFEGKKAQQDLFDGDEKKSNKSKSDDAGNIPAAETIEVVGAEKVAASGGDGLQ